MCGNFAVRFWKQCREFFPIFLEILSVIATTHSSGWLGLSSLRLNLGWSGDHYSNTLPLSSCSKSFAPSTVFKLKRTLFILSRTPPYTGMIFNLSVQSSLSKNYGITFLDAYIRVLFSKNSGLRALVFSVRSLDAPFLKDRARILAAVCVPSFCR